MRLQLSVLLSHEGWCLRRPHRERRLSSPLASNEVFLSSHDDNRDHMKCLNFHPQPAVRKHFSSPQWGWCQGTTIKEVRFFHSLSSSHKATLNIISLDISRVSQIPTPPHIYKVFPYPRGQQMSSRGICTSTSPGRNKALSHPPLLEGCQQN